MSKAALREKQREGGPTQPSRKGETAPAADIGGGDEEEGDGASCDYEVDDDDIEGVEGEEEG